MSNRLRVDSGVGRTSRPNRRQVLKAIGASAAGFATMTGTASAHEMQFFGCSQVCTGTDGNVAVVPVDGDYECRTISRGSSRNNVPWRWQSYCYEARPGEAIVGFLKEDVWVGDSRTEDGQCKLCLNPNDCASDYYDSASEVRDALNLSTTCGICQGNVVLAERCDAYGSSGRRGGNGADAGQEGGDGNGGGRGGDDDPGRARSDDDDEQGNGRGSGDGRGNGNSDHRGNGNGDGPGNANGADPGNGNGGGPENDNGRGNGAGGGQGNGKGR